MAKGFKVLISRIISSFQFYHSKNPSNFRENSVQLSPNPVFIDSPPATPPPFKPHGSSFKHHYTSEDDLTKSPEFKWDETPHREIYNSSIFSDFDNDLFPLPPPPSPAKKKRRSKKNKTTTRHPISTSSTDSGLHGCERDDEEEEIVMLVSFSQNHKKMIKGAKCNVSKGWKVWSPKIESPVRLSG
ncbi:hypothetical protein ACSBR1_037558 [Camellia fascicularis]